MIASGSRVLIRKDGTDVEVESLKISDLIFNPLSEQYSEISDILTRTVDLTEEGLAAYFVPIRFPKGAFGTHLPMRDTLVSPAQILLRAAESAGSSYKVVDDFHACELDAFSQPIKGADHGKITYHAIFCDEPQYALVNGLLMRLLDPSIYEEDVIDASDGIFDYVTSSPTGFSRVFDI